MTTIVEQQNKINELLNGGRPVTLETIAQAYDFLIDNDY